MNFRNFATLFLSILLFAGCTRPLTVSYKPYKEVYSNNNAIAEFTTYSFIVNGDPYDDLLEHQIFNIIKNNLSTLGYLENTNPSFSIYLTYSTISNNVLSSNYILIPSPSGIYGYFSPYSGLNKLFEHSISLSIHDNKDSKQIWKGYTELISTSKDIRPSLDILIRNLLATIPERETQIRETKLINTEKAELFYNTYVYKRDFSMPNFDYYIYFPRETENRPEFNGYKYLEKITDNLGYLAGYIDMLTYGRYYLLYEYDLEIFGQYKIDDKNIYLLVEATRSFDRYKVTKMMPISKDEYAKKLKTRNTLLRERNEKYDFFN